MFRALDTETGKSVAVRRIFPFGADGGGLHADEQNAYNITINRLAGVCHPALRSVICGGCDPVDGMPYIATEWIQGEPLDSFIEHGPLSAEVATEVIALALEVSELLSHALAENDVWVDTRLQTIIVGNNQSDRGFTFWIRPMKWLGSLEEARGMESIADMTEEIMGWKGLGINDQSGYGLAAWLTWLRQAEGFISLRDARETLAAIVGAKSPPVKRLVRQGTRPPSHTIAQPSSKAPWIINIGLALITIGLGGWFLIRQRALESSRMRQPPEQALASNPYPAPTPPRTVHLPPAQETAVPPTVSNDAAAAAEATQMLEAATPPADNSHAAAPLVEVIPWTENDRLILENGKKVIVEGRFEKISFSHKRRPKTMYLLFSQKPEDSDTCGAVVDINSAPQDVSETALQPLLGTKIRIHGIVQIKNNSDTKRAEILIKDRASIEPME